jgi:hypothetical protein
MITIAAILFAVWLAGFSEAAIANRMSHRFLTPKVTGTRSMLVQGFIVLGYHEHLLVRIGNRWRDLVAAGA